MDRNALINMSVDLEIETLFKGKSDIINFLKYHPRKQLLIDNLNSQIRICELRPSLDMTVEKVIELCIDFTRTFAKVALNVKEQEINDEHIRQAKIEGDKRRRHEEEMNAPIHEIMGDVQEVVRGEASKVNA